MPNKSTSVWQQNATEEYQRILIQSIVPRIEDIRELVPKSLLEIASSIVETGRILQPIVLDRHLRLIAGQHRWRAVQLLCSANRMDEWESFFKRQPTASEKRLLEALPEWTQKDIEAKVLDIDTTKAYVTGMKIEISENEKRANLTRQQIRTVAEKLRRDGAENHRGRPRSGSRSLLAELEGCFHVSRRTILRSLEDPTPKPVKPSKQSSKSMCKTLRTWKERLHPDALPKDRCDMIHSAINDLIAALELGNED